MKKKMEKSNKLSSNSNLWNNKTKESTGSWCDGNKDTKSLKNREIKKLQILKKKRMFS